MAASTDTPRTPFGERLLQAIHAADWTQTGFEAAARFTKGRISKLLTLPQTKFDTDLLLALRNMLDVRIDWLLWGEEPMRDPHPAPAVAALRDAHRLGVPYTLMVEVRASETARATAENWDRASWLEAYLAANKDRADAKGREKALLRTRKYQEKRTALWRQEFAHKVDEKKTLAETRAATDAARAAEEARVFAETPPPRKKPGRTG